MPFSFNHATQIIRKLKNFVFFFNKSNIWHSQDYNTGEKVYKYKKNAIILSMKKIILAIFLAFSAFLYAESNFLNEYNYAEFTLENGMQIFVLEDFSSAPVQVEFSVHAGISAQNPATTGFFPLYTRLFKYGAEKNSFLQNLTSECSADSSNYRISVSQELVPSTFEILARCAYFCGR